MRMCVHRISYYHSCTFVTRTLPHQPTLSSWYFGFSVARGYVEARSQTTQFLSCRTRADQLLSIPSNSVSTYSMLRACVTWKPWMRFFTRGTPKSDASVKLIRPVRYCFSAPVQRSQGGRRVRHKGRAAARATRGRRRDRPAVGSIGG